MEGITNLGKQVDAFEEAGEVHDDTDKVHVRVQQRNGRKCITTVRAEARRAEPA
jgi:translation initiation factor 1 (eIF-1/SUI1)